nr:unnamed protein product [Spirometra erinaceieuropaei]
MGPVPPNKANRRGLVPVTSSSEAAAKNALHRDIGLTFAVWSEIVGRSPRLPQGVKDRLLVCACLFKGPDSPPPPPSLNNQLNEAKNKFYEDMHVLLADKPVVLGDLDARVGTDYVDGIAGFSDNGPSSSSSCAKHLLLLMRWKATWLHLRSRR